MRINTEDIFCRAEIECKTSRYPIHIFIIGYILTRFFDNSLVNDIYNLWDSTYSSKDTWYGWKNIMYSCHDCFQDFFFIFSIPVMKNGYRDGVFDVDQKENILLPAGIILLAVSVIIIIAFPFIYSYIKRHNRKSSYLYLTKDCIYGLKKTFFRKRSVWIKLENLSDIYSYENLRDTLKKVETLYISYEGGEITFRNVKNAQDFVEAVMTQYKEVKQ